MQRVYVVVSVWEGVQLPASFYLSKRNNTAVILISGRFTYANSTAGFFSYALLLSTQRVTT